MQRYRKNRGMKERAAEKRDDHYKQVSVELLNTYCAPTDTGGPSWAELVEAGEVTMKEAGVVLGVDRSHVSHLHNAWKGGEWQAKQAAKWEPPEPYSDDPVEDFCLFREDCFQTATGDTYTTPEFQRRWLRAILDAFHGGGNLEVLSPPRHGKTELLTHFCVWLIVRYPNIRIVYVGGNSEIAEQSVESAKDHLELNEHLSKFVPPGTTFKPGTKSGRTWTKVRFTVGTRTVTGIKSPTMVAVGRGGKMPSRDADIIIVDDPEDHDSAISPGQREETRAWAAKSVMSRVESQTCLFVIGSRVHPDDLVGHIAQEPSFEVIIEQAHDPGCTLPEDQHEQHWSCMLWPEVRDHKWLMEKKNSPIQGPFFQMVYQNEALDDELAHFRPEDIDACYDPKRVLGHVPKGCRLIAGLDPSVSGHQAAFLWAIDVTGGPQHGKRYMVDIDNRTGGGIAPALDIMKRWHSKYDLRVWVVEENLYHGAIGADEQIRKWAQANYVQVNGHETYGNKWDKDFGVTSLARYFKTELDEGGRQVSLPTGDDESRDAVQLYRRQLINFNRDALGMSKKKRPTGDVLMASWFPEETIRSWLAEHMDTPDVLFDQTSYPFEPMALTASGWLG